MAKPYISSIVAVAKNDVIGKDNALLWHIPEDLKNFKKTTMGKPIIMGRKSYESIGKPLPGRPNIVISRSKKFDKISTLEGPFICPTIEESVTAAKKLATQMNVNEIMIIGGGEIYKQTLPITDRLYLTLIDKDYAGDAYFPAIDWNAWNIISEDKRDGDPAFTFYVLERK